MTAGFWTRHDDATEFTRVGAEGKGQVLALGDACACLRPSERDDNGAVSELEAQEDCRVCIGGYVSGARLAVDVWRILTLDPVPSALLGELLLVERLASYGLRWTTLDERGAPEGALDWQRQRRCAA